MISLETERLVLRRFTRDDFDAVHSYASVKENVIYMPWGPNSREETQTFLDRVIAEADENNPDKHYSFAVTLKSSGHLIGGCDIGMKDGSLGWILHRDYWKQGYCTELGRALLKFGFEDHNLHRIKACCDAENIGSYRVMEKIGMRREGIFLECRPANKLSTKKYEDTLWYAILKDEWEAQKEIVYYNSIPVIFNGFIDVPQLSDAMSFDSIHLVCTAKHSGNPEKKLVPAYEFAICKGGEKIGNIKLRIGYTDDLYYGGQIGYDINENYRGNGYAGRACRLLITVAKAHGMEKLLITNNETNTASKRVCEKLGCRFLRLARLPEWNDHYKKGDRFFNIFEWSIG